MTRSSWKCVALIVSILAAMAWIVGSATSRAEEGQGHGQAGGHEHPGDGQPDDNIHGKMNMPGEMHGHEGMAGHLHASTPADYRGAYVPASVWTSGPMIARGKEIYTARCAVCHGERGDGKGPAAAALPLKPPDFHDGDMIAEMRGNYWFWRVSEGGAVEPFKSMGSAMPAWKDVLPVEDRWAVIAYEHTFSGHAGPHVTSEHPAMGIGERPLHN